LKKPASVSDGMIFSSVNCRVGRVIREALRLSLSK
jgi:hypothetical protein